MKLQTLKFDQFEVRGVWLGNFMCSCTSEIVKKNHTIAKHRHSFDLFYLDKKFEQSKTLQLIG